MGFFQFELVLQQLVTEHGVAYDVHAGDGCNIPFLDRDVNGHPVTGQRSHFRRHPCTVPSLGDILALQLKLEAVEGRTLEHAAFTQPGLGKSIHQVFGFDGLVAFNFDLADRWPFADQHYQHIAVTFQADVLEITGLEQNTGGTGQGFGVDFIAHL